MGVQINGSEGNVIATKGTYSGNVTIGGTLTYEDVTNIDSVGLVTARNGIEIGARPGVAASISVDGNMIVSGISTVGQLISSYGTIVRSVNDNGITIAGGTASNSGANVTVYGGSHGSYPDTVRFRIDGSEKVRIDSSGKFGIGMSADQITALKGKLDIDASGIDAAGDTDDPNDYAIVIRNSSSTNSGNGIAFTNDSGAAVGGAIIHIDKGSNNIGDLSFLTSASSNTPEERLRITSDGKIGFGEDDPDGNYLLIRAASTVGTTKGHIMLTGDSATVGQGPQIVFSESGSASSFAGAYIGHMREGSNSTGNLVFGTRATSGDANTVPTERLRIYSNGAVLIGAAAGEAGGDAKLAIDCQGMNIYDGVGDASNYGLIFANDPTGNKANGIGFFNDSASTCGGYIVHQDKGGGNIGDLVFGTSASSDTPVERLRISSAGNVTVADGNLIFGANGNALDFQNQTIESTSNYNRTVTAEKIDYYEEGYFDPTAISAGLTWETSGNRQLRYVRIGNWVSVSGYLQLVSRTSNSNVIQVAMPFTSAPNSSGYYTRGVGAAMYQNVTLTTNYTELVSYVGGGENYMRFFQLRSGHGWQQLMNSILGSDSTTAIYFSINYMVA